MKDFQQNKVYEWESQFPEGDWVSYENAQMIIDYIWSEMGLKYPPKVQPLAPQVTKWAATADRLSVNLPKKGASTKTILHELAHSMTTNIEGKGHLHGPRFVGVYMQLLVKFMGLALLPLMGSAKIAGVQFDHCAKPAILDDEIDHML